MPMAFRQPPRHLERDAVGDRTEKLDSHSVILVMKERTPDNKATRCAVFHISFAHPGAARQTFAQRPRRHEYAPRSATSSPAFAAPQPPPGRCSAAEAQVSSAQSPMSPWFAPEMKAECLSIPTYKGRVKGGRRLPQPVLKTACHGR